jgi:Putative addiction module component
MMSLEVPIPPPDFDGPEYVTIPDWHKEILAERMVRYRPGVNEGITWEEFEQELTKG